LVQGMWTLGFACPRLMWTSGEWSQPLEYCSPGPPRWSRTTYDPLPLGGSCNWATASPRGLSVLACPTPNMLIFAAALWGAAVLGGYGWVSLVCATTDPCHLMSLICLSRRLSGLGKVFGSTKSGVSISYVLFRKTKYESPTYPSSIVFYNLLRPRHHFLRLSPSE
jgi:hypothetical protein